LRGSRRRTFSTMTRPLSAMILELSSVSIRREPNTVKRWRVCYECTGVQDHHYILVWVKNVKLK
jgi:hypothetical protein